MNIVRCFTSGLGRVLRTPSLIVWLYMTSIILALPLSIVMRDILQDSIGGSLVHQNLRQGFDLDWYSQFNFSKSGLADTFGPNVVGILPVLGNLDTFLSGFIFAENRIALMAAALFLIAWAFFGGGIISRYACSDEPFTRSNLFVNSGQYFFRFVRLSIISILLYLGFFRWVGFPLFRWMGRATRDVTVERTLIIYSVLAYSFVALVLMILSLASDYAKISMVVMGKRSAILAYLRGFRFVWKNPARTIGLYLLLALAGLALTGAFALIAPGPGQWRRILLLLAFAVTQAFVLCRIILKLWFLASETELYRARLEEQKAEAAVAPREPAPEAAPASTGS